MDGETVADSADLDVLLAFAHHPEIEVIGTDQRFSNVLSVGSYDRQHAFTSWEIKFDNGGMLSSGIPGPDIQHIGRRLATAGQEERAERAIVMVVGAGDHDGDAFVTTDPLLLEKFPRNVVQGGNPMTIEEAVALLGLFLRVREDFALDLGKGYSFSFDRSAFYLVLMRDLT